MKEEEAFRMRCQWWRDHFANGLPAYVGRILVAVSEETGVAVAEMRKPGRGTVAGLVARQLAVTRLRAETRLPLIGIAAVFNKRSHVAIQRLIKKQFEPCSEVK